MRYRDLDTGTFLTRDPIGYADGPNIYCYVHCNPITYFDAVGLHAYYNADGTFGWEDKDVDDNGDELAFTVTTDDKTGEPQRIASLGNRNEFETSASIVRQESGTDGKDEPLWIAHATNNEVERYNNNTFNNGATTTMYKKLMSGYSSVDSKDKTPLDAADSSDGANNARAAVIHALTGGADPTGGATRWDGVDFLAKGEPHDRFQDHGSVSIPKDTYKAYRDNVLKEYPKGVIRIKGIYYKTPASVFTAPRNWSGGNFKYNNTKNPQYKPTEATGTVGLTIFWK